MGGIRATQRGYAMAALLVALSVMSIMLSVALPTWRTIVQREREAELVFRGEQYMQAIGLFSRRTGGFPTSLNALRDGRYIRKLYKDPITNGDFQPVFLGQVAIGAGGAATPVGQVALPVGRGGTAPLGGRGLQPATGAAPLGGAPTQMGTGLGQPTAGAPGQTAQSVGPIIGVMSRSTAQSLRLYNGRGRYNEWLFVSTAATAQPGVPAGSQTPGLGPPGRGAQPQPQIPGRGRGPGLLDGPNPGGNRGLPGPGRATPFGGPNTPQPFPQGRRGRI